MEQSLKARLIGAAVLVALAVMLVPELLTGRGPGVEAPAPGESPGSRTFTIEIGDSGNRPAVPAPVAAAPAAAGNARAEGAGATRSAAAEAPSPSSVPEAPRAGPTTVAPVIAGPQAPAGDAAGTSSSGVPAAPGPEARIAQPGRPAPAPSVPQAGTGWMVQVGAFGTAEAARSVVQDLQASGIAAQVSPVSRGGRTLHRVRAGPVADRAEAERLAQRLAARGLPATVVAGD